VLVSICKTKRWKSIFTLPTVVIYLLPRDCDIIYAYWKVKYLVGYAYWKVKYHVG